MIKRKIFYMREPILEIKHLTKYYGKILGVKDLSLALYKGEIFGFIGPNGAGKSTTIRSIMHLVNKTSGQVLLYGQELTGEDPALKESIGYLPSEVHLYEDLTVKEMLDYHASFYKRDLSQRRRELVKKLQLDETKKIEDLSLGNSKKLGIILAFMHEPKLLILDEPISGLDPIMQQTFYSLLKEEKQKGTTILYSTHILSEISKICDRIGIIREGKLVNVETTRELQAKNFVYVTITAKDVDGIVKSLGLEDFEREDNTVRFKNNLPLNELVRALADYDLQELLIEEATIEDMLLHYYK